MQIIDTIENALALGLVGPLVVLTIFYFIGRVAAVKS